MMSTNTLPVADVRIIEFNSIYPLVNINCVFSGISVEPLNGAPMAISFGASLPLSRILAMVEGMGLGMLNIYSGSQFIATTEY